MKFMYSCMHIVAAKKKDLIQDIVQVIVTELIDSVFGFLPLHEVVNELNEFYDVHQAQMFMPFGRTYTL